jgi:predicted nucleotidyltransferase
MVEKAVSARLAVSQSSSAHDVELRQRSLSLFGSLARGETKTGSDIDFAAGGHENEIAGIVQLDFQ